MKNETPNFSEAWGSAEHGDATRSDVARNALLYRWWCDEKIRPALYQWVAEEHGGRLKFRSRARGAPDAQGHAPPVDGGFCDAVLLVGAEGLQALKQAEVYTNAPYQALADGPLMLAADARPGGPHGRMRERAMGLLNAFHLSPAHLEAVAETAAQSAAVLPLKQAEFDLAGYARDVALRYIALLFGTPPQALPFILPALDAAYRALNFVLVGRHFEPYSQAKGREAKDVMDKLRTKVAQWIDDYRCYLPHRFPEPPESDPDLVSVKLVLDDDAPQEAKDVSNAILLIRRVQDAQGRRVLRSFKPLLACMADAADGMIPDVPVSSEELAALAVEMMGGAFGQIQTAICHIVRKAVGSSDVHIATGPDLRALKAARTRVMELLASDPPAPILGRTVFNAQGARTLEVLIATATLPQGTGLEGTFGAGAHACPARPRPASSAVTGQDGPELALPVVHRASALILNLQGLDAGRNLATFKTVGLKKTWGAVCETYPIRHEVRQRLAQQCLNVRFAVKSPVSEHAEAIRTILKFGASRMEDSLNRIRNVHFAWFDLVDGDREFLLETVFEGDIDTYLRRFADLEFPVFDSLFDHLDDAPPRPVRQFQAAFVETVIRHHRKPAAGYFYSAYPRASIAQIAEGLDSLIQKETAGGGAPPGAST